MNGRVTTLLVALLGVLFFSSLVVSGWALYDRFAQTDERRARQAAINERLNMISLENCREIEKLKKAERDRAIQARRQLRETLRLLRLPLTAEIRAAANRTKFEALKRYAPEPCPRQRGGS